MSQDPCPLCGQHLGHGKPIDVCSPCHAAMTGAVRTTAEFSVPDLDAALRTGAAEPRPPTDAAGCSWCGKAGHQVRRLLSSRHARICDECVSLCAAALESELGPSWSE